MNTHSIPAHLRSPHLSGMRAPNEVLSWYLPGRIMAEGSSGAPSPTQLWMGPTAASNTPPAGRPEALVNWTPDQFESDFERHCDSAFDHLDIESLMREQHHLRHFE